MSAAELREAAEKLRMLGTMSAAALALEVGCPTCNARAGSPCQAMDGPARCTHKARRHSGFVLRMAFGLMVPCEEFAYLLWLLADHASGANRAAAPLCGSCEEAATGIAHRVLGSAP